MVRNIKATGKRYDLTKGNGFCLRVSAKGQKSWVYSYWFNGESKRFTVGYYPALSIAQAIKAVTDAALLKDNGIDPLQQKIDKQEAIRQEQARELKTIEWLATEFYTEYIEKTRKSPLNVKQIIHTEIINNLGKIKLDEITARQIVKSLKPIVDRGARSHANKTLAIIKQMFSYAVSVGLIEINPAQGIKSSVIGGKETPRDRNLSLEEIKLIWQWLDNESNHKLHPATPTALKILLLTGVRSGELRTAEWSEIDFNSSLWTIPPEKYKTGIKHKVHLTEFTIKHLQELKDLSGSKWVLPSIKDTNKPLSDKALARAVKRTESRIKDVAPWTPHDLRRTFNTQLSAMGILPHISEKCLGHKLPGIMATYNKHEYLSERKEALEQWANKIEMLVNNSNVVILNTQQN